MIEALIGFIGVVIGAVLTGAKDIWTDRRARHKNAEYLAVRIVSVLDRYVKGCTEVVYDDGLCQGQPDAEGFSKVQVSTPAFDIESIDVDWKTVPVKLMYEVLSFSNFIDAADHRISGAFEYYAHPPEYEEGFEERQYQYAKIGLKASSLADELRSTYGIPSRDYYDWNPVKCLSECKSNIEALRATRLEQHVSQA